jgi:hypothetical protein
LNSKAGINGKWQGQTDFDGPISISSARAIADVGTAFGDPHRHRGLVAGSEVAGSAKSKRGNPCNNI